MNHNQQRGLNLCLCSLSCLFHGLSGKNKAHALLQWRKDKVDYNIRLYNIVRLFKVWQHLLPLFTIPPQNVT